MSISPRWIIEDDTSSNIHYTQGSWFEDSSGSQDAYGNSGPVFQGTLHGVRTGPASLEFTFTGSRVKLLGSNNIQNNSGILNPSWECFVDGVSIGSYPYQLPQNNWQFCRSPFLPDGQHVLTVNASVSSPQTFWVDQIQYIPTLDSQFTNATVLVDALDPVVELGYGKGWGPLGGGGKMTNVTGSTFTFNFTGISVGWYGFMSRDFPLVATTASYSIDGQAPASFLLEGLPNNDKITQYGQKFFQSPVLSAGEHQIVVTYNGNGQTTPLVLDYLVIQNSSVPTTSTLTNLGPDVGSSPTSGKKSHIGAIVGGAAGGIVAISLLALVCIFIRGRRRSKGRPTLNKDNILDNTAPRPYEYYPVVPNTMSEVGGTVHNAATSTMSPGALGSYAPGQASQSVFESSRTGPGENTLTGSSVSASDVQLYSTRSEKLQREAAANTAAAMHDQRRNPAAAVLPPQTDNSTQTRYLRHEDSGLRMPAPVVEVPPQYTMS